MRLYFLRHGKAADRATWQQSDDLRPLTDEGRAETRRAALGLAAIDGGQSLGIERICTSPLVRARETAALTAEVLHLPVEERAELAAGCDLDALAHVAAAASSAHGLLLVGHEPDFSTLIGQLIAGRAGAAIKLKKGACCRVDLGERALAAAGQEPRKLLGSGELVWLLTAAQLGAMARGRPPRASVPAPAKPPRGSRPL
jgi:phosphohistidine phosphatase